MKNLTIIGFGNIGQVFARELRPYFNITVANRSDKSKLAKKMKVAFTQDIKNSVKNADYVILAVPVSSLHRVVEQIREKVPSKAWVMDTCAVKEIPMKIMSQLKCNVMGMHPQFRNVNSVKDKSIILVGKTDHYMKLIFKKVGLRTLIMTPKKHDRLKSIVSLAHFIGLGLRNLLNSHDKETLRKYSGASSMYLLKLIESMENNSIKTYEDIQRSNRHSKNIRRRFIKTIQKLDDKMSRKQIR